MKTKEFIIGKQVAWVEIKNNKTLWVEWKYINKGPNEIRSVWFDTVNEKKHLYSTATQWDELDDILSGLGVIAVKQNSWAYDDFGEIEKFTRTTYDFTKLLHNVY